MKEKISFFGFGMQYIRFAREEPELYRLLFLMRPDNLGIGAFATMRRMQELVRPSLAEIYHISEQEADRYFRDLWLVVHSLSTLIVTGDCPYSDREIGQILTYPPICMESIMLPLVVKRGGKPVSVIMIGD